jgi:hypothetical protein
MRVDLGLILLFLVLSVFVSAASDDLDQDGIIDSKDNCPGNYNPGQEDSDGDGVGDACQTKVADSDGDGVTDSQDQCPDEYGKSQSGCPIQETDSCSTDSDGDGSPDCQDQCPNEYGAEKNGCPAQQTTSCKLDSDQDGVNDCYDQCPYEYGTGKAGCPDAASANCKLDSDLDGTSDCYDQCPYEYGTGKGGCPGVAGKCAMDSDKDGVGDCDDLCIDEYGPYSNKGCPNYKSLTTTTLAWLQTTTTIMTPQGGTMCLPVAGTITGFPYNVNTLIIEARRVGPLPSGGKDQNTIGFPGKNPLTIEPQNPPMPAKVGVMERLTGPALTAYPEIVGDTFSLRYSICLPSGQWAVYPKFNNSGGFCEWSERWTPYYHLVNMTRGQLDKHFTYSPREVNVPTVTLVVAVNNAAGYTSTGQPRNYILSMSSTDASGIRWTSIGAVDPAGTGQLGLQMCTSPNCTITSRLGPLPDSMEYMTVRAEACDMEGNSQVVTRRVDLTSCYDARQNGRETGIDCGGICPACISCTWCGRNVTPIIIRGRPNDGYIDVVFVADSTYSVRDFNEFISDAKYIITKAYYTLHERTQPPLSLNYRNKFNFYYWNHVNQVIANSTNPIPIPPGFWTAAPFTDAAPEIYYTTGGLGGVSWWPPRAFHRTPGRYRNYPSDVIPQIHGQALHEAGHGIFDLVDTYCDPRTPYKQISTWPNVWTSLSSCRNDIHGRGWNNTHCRQVADVGCALPYYRYDTDVPEDDVMEWGMNLFGPAGSRRLKWVFEEQYVTG